MQDKFTGISTNMYKTYLQNESAPNVELGMLHQYQY